MKDLGDRMKGYEAVFDHVLPARIPVVLRLDGNSFSKFTREAGFAKPFDERMLTAMVAGTTAVLEYCTGSLLGYTQSDESTILLRNDSSPNETAKGQPFLGNRVQKLASLCAATFTDAFSRALRDQGVDVPPVAFDCRAFVVPRHDVNNCFLWRQRDAFKNCVSAVAHYGLAEKHGARKAHDILHGVSESGRQEIIFRELGQNVNDLPTRWKRGVCVRRVRTSEPIRDVLGEAKYAELLEKGHVTPGQVVERNPWQPDFDIPRFEHDRGYVEALLD